MSLWTFRVFITERREDVIGTWLEGLPKKVEAKIDRRIAYLRAIEHWKRPEFDKLTGYDNLHEIRVVFSGVQYRVIGCYGPGKREFTMLIGAVEKDNKLEPREALKIAVNRSKLINQSKHTAVFIE